MDVRICRQNGVERLHQLRERRGDIALAEQAPHHGLRRFGETQELVVVAVLMSAANGEGFPSTLTGTK